MTLNTTRSLVPHICVNNGPDSKISLHLALRPAFFSQIWVAVHFETNAPNDSKFEFHISVRFFFFLLYDHHFSRNKFADNENPTQWPWTLNSQKYLTCTKYLPPNTPNFGLLRSMTSRFPDTRLSKIGNTSNDLKITEYLTIKSTLYTLNT